MLPSLDLVSALMVGLLGSMGHCLGMCGGLVATISLRQRALTGQTGGAAATFGLISMQAVVHLGRITTYVGLGIALGLVGAAAQAVGGGLRGWQGFLSLIAGFAMLVMGLSLMGVLPPLEGMIAGMTSGQSRLGRALRRTMADLSLWGSYSLGLLWGLLPCGMVYAMAIKAATAGSPGAAGMTMAAFGLGTAPVLLGLGAATTAFSHRMRTGFYRAAGFLILVFGIQAILRGLTALGFVQHLRFGSVVFW